MLDWIALHLDNSMSHFAYELRGCFFPPPCLSSLPPLHLNGPLLHCKLQKSRADASFNTWVRSLHTVYILYNKKSNQSTYFSNKDGVALQLGALKGR